MRISLKMGLMLVLMRTVLAFDYHITDLQTVPLAAMKEET